MEITAEMRPSVHPIEAAPKCADCTESGKKLFDFDCQFCEAIVADDLTSISQLMAIARQWSPTVQRKMNVLVMEMLRRGAHPDDRDALTDMTLLHFTCKSGAAGLGNAETALETAQFLIEKAGANPNVQCRWNNMTAIHFAAYYDVAPLVGYLVTVVSPEVIDQPCSSGRTALHLAAENLSLQSAKVLIGASASVLLSDHQGRRPLDCVPDDKHLQEAFVCYKKKHKDIADELRTMLRETTLASEPQLSPIDLEQLRSAKVVLSALGLALGDRVVVGNAKVGVLKYCGRTRFASGLWAGVALDEQIGKHDGTIDGVRYFTCQPKHGIFAPLNKLAKLELDDYDLMTSLSCKQYTGQSNGGRWYHSTVPKIDTGLCRSNRFSETNGMLSSSSSSVNSEDVHIGSRVFLTDRKTGVVRFIGMTQFADGLWYGIELSRPLGRNDGSVQGIRYFHCPDKHGVFVQFSRIARLLSPKRRETISSSFTQNAYESDETGSDASLSISGTSSLDININQSPMASSRMVCSSSNLSSNFRRTISFRRSFNLTRSTSKATLDHAAKEQSWLRVGVNVLVKGMVACVRYIGPIENHPGIFLGVELRTPNGMNDGSIDGVRYFTCKPKFGLLVRPDKVTVRGIKASKLLSDEHLSNCNIGKSKEI